MDASPRGPTPASSPLTTVLGCLSRSVQDTARFFDACNGFDQRDPLSLPAVGGWEAGLGTQDLAGRTVAILPDLGTARVRGEVADVVAAFAEELAKAARLRVVDVTPSLPPLRGQWAMAGQVGFVADLGDAYPDRIEDLSPEMRFGLEGGAGPFQSGQGRFHRVVSSPVERGDG